MLDGWPYEPGKAMVRKVEGKDGRELIQMRIDLGLLQMYTAGRPDGQRPHDADSLLDYQVQRLEDHLAEHDGEDEGFSLTSEECLALQQEAIQFHHRYICFFQLEDFEKSFRMPIAISMRLSWWNNMVRKTKWSGPCVSSPLNSF